MDNNSSRFNNNNRRDKTSSVVVVKKKSFSFLKKEEEKKPVDEPEEKKEAVAKEEKPSKEVDHNQYFSETKTSGNDKIRNLDADYGTKKVSKEKVVEKKQKPKEKPKPQEKGEAQEFKFDDYFKEEQKTEQKKNILSDITIISHSKDKKYNEVHEGSNFLNKKNFSSQRKTNNFEDDEEERLRSIASIKRAREKNKKSKHDADQEKKTKEIIIPEIITVQELANRMAVRSADVVKVLMKMGMMITASKPIDADTAELIVDEFGHTAKRVLDSDIENILENGERDNPAKQKPRSPVVSVMGHVDHGKTSLLDALRETDVVSSESGGITQHIGASRIKVKTGDYVTFLDTPGHEAFTAMRLRGAHATDMVILVVAADDGIKEQTIEAINHAKQADIPIIVAINKIDKEGADSTRVVNELLSHEIVTEAMGGDVLCVEVSAIKKTNLDKLIEAIQLQSEILELKANPECDASGVVIESKVDKAKGVLVTLLVESGNLNVGDIVVAGTTYGKIRLLSDDKGVKITKLLPSEPAEVLGLNEAPESGEKFYVVDSEKTARDIVDYRVKKQKDKEAAKKSKKTLEDIFSHMSDEEQKLLSVIVKADVKGSVEAIVNSLEKIDNEEVKIKVIHSAVGGITESDLVLAKASEAIIIAFNVRLNSVVANSDMAREVDIKYYSVIYNIMDDINAAIKGMLDPVEKIIELGKGEIREVFDLSKYGKVAGSYVTSGIAKKSGKCRIIRDSVVISETDIKALKHFKDNVKEVNTGSECGISFENCTDFLQGDQLEFFEVVEEKN